MNCRMENYWIQGESEKLIFTDPGPNEAITIPKKNDILVETRKQVCWFTGKRYLRQRHSQEEGYSIYRFLGKKKTNTTWAKEYEEVF